jgi:hypothetical protein
MPGVYLHFTDEERDRKEATGRSHKELWLRGIEAEEADIHMTKAHEEEERKASTQEAVDRR